MTPWQVARSLEQLREQINTAAPNRSKASDGDIGDAAHFSSGSASDHNPWVDGNVVTAIDITHDPAHGCDVWVIAKAIAASGDRRLKYLIYTGGTGGQPGILSSTVSPWMWRTRAVDDHPKHLHVSVMPDLDRYDSAAKWALTRPVTTSQSPSKANSTAPRKATMQLIKGDTDSKVFITNGLAKRHVGPGEVRDLLRMTGQPSFLIVSQSTCDRIPTQAAGK